VTEPDQTEAGCCLWRHVPPSCGSHAGIHPEKARSREDRWVKCPRRRGVPSGPRRRIHSEGRLSHMPLRLCSVGFKSATGISHSVDVEAETLYEAAALGLARLKKDGWTKVWVRELASRSKSENLARRRSCDNCSSPKDYQLHLSSDPERGRITS
jgi:hypothetical protein